MHEDRANIELPSITDSGQVWREFRKLFILGKLEYAVQTDLNAGELATLLVDRVRQIEREEKGEDRILPLPEGLPAETWDSD
jgi:hypothetical protein